MRRRDFLTLLGGAAAWPLAAGAQQPGKLHTIGLLNAASAPTTNALFDGLLKLGWVEGKNISFERRYADNKLERLPELAAELVRRKVDLIVAFGTLAPLAARQATSTIPIVMAAAGDPVGSGLVASLARPGGNVTGMSLMSPDLAGKRLELLREVVPRLTRLAVLWNATNPYPAAEFRETETAGRTLGIEVRSLEVRDPDDFDAAFEMAQRQPPDALLTIGDPLTAGQRKLIADRAVALRLPALYGALDFVTAGGLMSYGASVADLQRRAAGHVDKILRGASPADLPVQQPTKFELAINLKTARALGLEVPAAAGPRRRGDRMKRREFITLLGGAAAAWPVAARAQQTAIPVIGFLHGGSPVAWPNEMRGFHRGLKEVGFVESENVAIVYRWAEGQPDRLPALAAELVRRQVSVIVAFAPAAALAAKAATATIPIVFLVSLDPVGLGLVASLARPGGNLTGINFFATELAAKRLELLRELVPAATRIAVLVNPANPVTADSTVRDVETAAHAMGLQTQVLNASNGREIDAVFTGLARDRPDALYVGADQLFTVRSVQLVQLAARLAVPAIYSGRRFTDIGGLMTYGTHIADSYRQIGVYTGRVLKGAKPADLPVEQSTKFELVINAQTAGTLGLTVPDRLLARADEVIE